MTLSKQFFISIVLFFISTFSPAQSNSELSLSGKWTASCPPEILDHASMRHCELCPFVINPKNKSQGEVKDIEMTFQPDSVTLNQNGKLTTVSYTRNKDTHAVAFMCNNKQYYFRVFLDGERRILEDSDGMILVLEKVK